MEGFLIVLDCVNGQNLTHDGQNPYNEQVSKECAEAPTDVHTVGVSFTEDYRSGDPIDSVAIHFSMLAVLFEVGIVSASSNYEKVVKDCQVARDV